MKNAAVLVVTTMLFASACSTTPTSPSAGAKNAGKENVNVVIYRPREPADTSGVTYTLYVDGKDSGRLRSQRYLKLALTPGKHVLGSSAAESQPVTIDVKETTIWMEAQIKPAPEHGIVLTPVSRQHAEKQLPALAAK